MRAVVRRTPTWTPFTGVTPKSGVHATGSTAAVTCALVGASPRTMDRSPDRAIERSAVWPIQMRHAICTVCGIPAGGGSSAGLRRLGIPMAAEPAALAELDHRSAEVRH